MTFDIPLAEQKVKPHQVTALHLVAGFALLGASALAFLLNNLTLPGINGKPIHFGSPAFGWVDGFIAVAIILSLVIIISALFRNKWLRSAKVNMAFRLIELLAAVVAAIYLLSIELNTPAAIFGVLAATIAYSLFLENSNAKSLFVTINEQGIKLPFASRRRNLNWVEVDQVLLRHGNLTINCANNRMYQWTAGQHDIDIETFEAFCNALIEAGKKKRVTDDW